MGMYSGVVKSDFPSANMIIGKQGVGKSTLGRCIIEDDFESGEYCCIDLSDFGKCENACYAIPNFHTEVYDSFNAKCFSHDNSFVSVKFVPKAFPTIIYVPAVRGIPNKLPNIFQPYRIAFQDLEFDEFILLCGFRGDEVAVELLELSWSGKKDDESFEEFIKRAILMAGYGSIIAKVDDVSFQVNTAERRSFAPLLRRIKRLWDSSLICDRGDKLALDLNSIMLDKTKIHSFTMAYLSDVNIQYTLYGFLLRRIHTMRIRPQVEYPLLSLSIREVHKIAPSGSDVLEGQRISRYYLFILVRDCRHVGTWIYMDTQDHRTVYWKVWSGVLYTWFIFRSDKVVVNDLQQQFYIPDSIAYDIPKYPVGVCATKFDDIKSPCVYPPPRSLVKDYREQFMFLWEGMKGGYRKWKFEFSDTGELIKLSVPEQPQAKLGARDRKWYDKIIEWTMWYCNKHLSIIIDDVCAAHHITKEQFGIIRSQEKFKNFLVVNNGVISEKIL